MSKKQKNQAQNDEFADTKTHVLNAGKEILLAAQGALSFCKHYVETSKKEKNNPELIEFFSKALEVAEDLGRGLNKKPRSEKEEK